MSDDEKNQRTTNKHERQFSLSFGVNGLKGCKTNCSLQAGAPCNQTFFKIAVSDFDTYKSARSNRTRCKRNVHTAVSYEPESTYVSKL